MPGNEVGDRIHNFFAQDNLSQGQHHSETADESWTGLGNNLWDGGQRQIGTPFISNVKIQPGQASVDAERVYGRQSSMGLHGVNLADQSVRSQPEDQQPTANGYMHGNPLFQANNNGANPFGADKDNDRPTLTSRGFSILDAHWQHMSNHHPGMSHALSRQQSGINDVQSLQQQVMLKQMQEMQRQQRLHQQESRHLSSVNQVSSFPRLAAGGHPSAMVNGIPTHGASIYSWKAEHMPSKSNWSQHVASRAMQGSSNEVLFSPEQGQSPSLMGLIPQHRDQSLQGIPISRTQISPNQYSPVQMDKSTIQQTGGIKNSFGGNYYANYPANVGIEDGTLANSQGNQGERVVGFADTQNLNGALNLGSLQQVDARKSNGPAQHLHSRQDSHGSLDAPPEKTMMQVGSSQNVATLDPTEEKILFGSDDNLWEAFGRSVDVGSGGNMLDGGDASGSFPSLQSGSWSALMQSAVAETSSADVGVQEEWTGLFGNRPSSNAYDSVKPQSSWDDSRLQSSTMSITRPYGISDGFNSSVSHNNMPGPKQSGTCQSNEDCERMHTGFTQNYAHPFSGEGTKPLHAVTNVKHISGSWMNQQSISPGDFGGQPSSTQNGLKFVDSVSHGAHTVLKNPGNTNPSQASQSMERKNIMYEDAAGLQKNDSASRSLGLEQEKSSTGSPKVSREECGSNNAVFAESSAGKAHLESCEQIGNGSNIDIWKHASSSVKSKGRDFPGKHQPQMDMNQQIVESGNCSYSNGVVDTKDYSDKKESKTNSIRHVDPYYSASGIRENGRLDASGSLALSGSKGKPSNIIQKPPGIRKFQYHPMGDVDADVEPSYTHRQSMLSQVSPGLKGQDHVDTRQPIFPAQMARNSVEPDKGQFPGFQGDRKGLDETASKTIVSGSSKSKSFETGGCNDAIGRTTQPSQNMLQLLHKVDQSGEHGSTTNLTSDCNQQSEMHEIRNFDGSNHFHQNKSATSQGFGLQLGPPAQLLPTIDHPNSYQSPSGVGEKGRIWLSSASPVQELPLSHQASQGELRRKTSSTFGHSGKNIHGGNSSVEISPGFSYPNHLQNQHAYNASGQTVTNQSSSLDYERLSSQSKQVGESFGKAYSSQSLASAQDTSGSIVLGSKSASGGIRSSSKNIPNNGMDSDHQFPILESVTANQGSSVYGAPLGNSAKMAHNMWNRVSNQQHSFSDRHSRDQYNVFKQNNVSETSSGLHKLNAQEMIGNMPSEIGGTAMCSNGFAGKQQPVGDPSQNVPPENDLPKSTMTVSQGADSALTCVPGTCISNPTSTQKDIEAFGRSLRPSNFSHQNYSLTHQVHGMENEEIDISNRSSKRFKGSDDYVDVQEGGKQFYNHNDRVKDASSAHTTKLSDAQDAVLPSQELGTFSKKEAQNYSNSSGVSVRTEYSKISPQMAPSWFDEYRTFKNGRISPLADARNISSTKTLELPYNVGRPTSSLCSPSLAEKGNTVGAGAVQHALVPKSVASENLFSQVTNPNVAEARMIVARPKKRKTATSELVPWYKQLVHGLCIPQDISSAVLEWAHAANRLSEKVEDNFEIVDDGPPLYRSKRRLVTTTQLMQLLFSPPSASVLSLNAMSHYHTVVHFLARSTVGDACSSLPGAGSDTLVPSRGGNILPEKLKASERTSKQHFLKVVEELISRARKLENNILRLDKSESVLDLRVECQELEKYSVINRFAKFHGRAQADAADMSSPDSPSNAQKSSLQRYVTAIPMPKNIPDRVQCLSL